MKCSAVRSLALTVLVGFLTAGCGQTVPSAPHSGVSTGATWSETNAKFATAVDAEKAPESMNELRLAAVNPTLKPSQRAAALRELGRKKDFEGMPTVIAALDDDTREVRGEAYIAATRIVGTGIRVRDYDSPERRRPAVEAYHRLFKLAQENNVHYFIDLVPLLLERMDDPNETVRRDAGQDIERLMDSSYDFRAEAPHNQRLSAIAAFRKEWTEWNAPGSQMVEIRRDPEKMRAFKEKLLQNIREKEAKGIPWTTDTRQRDAAAEASVQAGK